jgi:hypothetical protein
MISNKLLTDMLVMATEYSMTRDAPLKLVFPDDTHLRVYVMGKVVGLLMEVTLAPHGYAEKEFIMKLFAANELLKKLRTWPPDKVSTLILANGELTVVCGELYFQIRHYVPPKYEDYTKPYLKNRTSNAVRLDSIVLGVVLHECNKLTGCKNPVITTHGPPPGAALVVDFIGHSIRVKAALAPVTMDPNYDGGEG